MRDMIKMGLILLLITSVSGVILGVTNSFTDEVIQERALENMMESIGVLIPEAEDLDMIEDEEILSRDLIREVYVGYKGGNVAGYAIKATSQGYGGDVVIMVGIVGDGTISGVQILEQSETPGLGTKVMEKDFLDGYRGRSTSEDVAVDVIGGATVSSVAVNRGVEAAASLYEEALGSR